MESNPANDISNILEKNNYIVFDQQHFLVTPQETEELNNLIEKIGKEKRYGRGDAGGTHKKADYGYIVYLIINSGSDEAPNLEYDTLQKDDNWMRFDNDIKSSLLNDDDKLLILDTLFQKIVSVLPKLSANTGYVVQIKLVCSREESHVELQQHQDGVNYLFTLLTSTKDIKGGEMTLRRLGKNMRKDLVQGKYFYGPAEEFSLNNPNSGAGYIIKERPNSWQEESDFEPILHGHNPWSKNGDRPTRNIVIGRVILIKQEKDSRNPGQFKLSAKKYRNE